MRLVPRRLSSARRFQRNQPTRPGDNLGRVTPLPPTSTAPDFTVPDNSSRITGRDEWTVCTPSNPSGLPISMRPPSLRLPLPVQYVRGPTISAAPPRHPQRTAKAIADGGEVLAIPESDWAAVFGPLKRAGGSGGDALAVIQALAEHGLKGDADGIRAAVQKVKGQRTVFVRTARGGIAGLVDRVAGLSRWLRQSGDDTVRAARVVLQKTGGVVGNAKGARTAGGIGILLVGSMTLIEAALSDEEIAARTLGLTLLVDALKGAAAAATGAAAGVLIGAILTAAGAAAAPVVLVAAAGLVVGFVVGWALDTLLPTDRIVAAVESQLDAAYAAYLEATAPAREAWWKFERTLNWINTYEGMLWLNRQLGGAPRPFSRPY